MTILEKQMEQVAAGADKGFGDLYYHVMPDWINRYPLALVTGAEIGVCMAGHSKIILEKTKVKKLYSVDPYMAFLNVTDGHVLPDGRSFDQAAYDAMYEFAKKRMSAFGDRSVFIRKTSVDAAAEIKELLDFVFIDAQHTYRALCEDISIWKEKVRRYGVISGHDYNHPSYPGIKKAVDEYFPNATICDGYVWIASNE